MTWHASVMPDDALPPDSLIGSMLNPTTEESSAVQSEPPPATLEPLPLWRVMHDAGLSEPINNESLDADCACQCAAQVEALRDWLLPDEPEPHPAQPFIDEIQAQWEERQRLRALLTEQARIARGD